MSKLNKFLTLFFVSPFLLASCNRSQATPDQEDNSLYQFNQRIVHIDEDGSKYYIALEFDSIDLVDEQSTQLKIVKIDESTLKPIDYIKYNDNRFTFSIKEDNGAITMTSTGILTGVKPGKVDVLLLNKEGERYDAVKVNVANKTLESISVTGYKTEYEVNKNPSIKFNLTANFSNNYSKQIASNEYGVLTDKSSINYKEIGTYPVKVSYYYRGVTKEVSFNIDIVSEFTVKFEPMNINYDDLLENAYGHYRRSPRKGNVKWLVVPVWFNNSNTFIATDKKDEIKEDIEKVFFGTREDVGWHSVASFYHEESMHQLNLTGTVTDWYDVPYHTNQINAEGGYSSNKLASAVLEWYFTYSGDNFADYDLDGDNYIDGLAIIYGCPSSGDASPVENKTFWPKVSAYGTPAGPASSPSVSSYMWTSYDDFYSAGERALERTGNAYGIGDNTLVTLDTHVVLHESGHMFGLDDYYDYGPNDYLPLARFSLQDNNVGCHDPWSQLALGWGKYYAPTGSVTVDLSDSQSEHNFIVLSPEMNLEGSAFDEFLIVDLFSPNGLNGMDTSHSWKGIYNTGPQEPGIRVLHVDARLTEHYNPDINNLFVDPTQPGVESAQIAMSNSYDEPGRITILGEEYQDYNQLQIIHNLEENNHHSKTVLRDYSLWHAGDTFTMSKYGKQFVNEGILNNGKSLGWEFTVEAIYNVGETSYATINFKKI